MTLLKKMVIRGKLKVINVIMRKARNGEDMSSRKKGLYLILLGIVILALKLSFNTGLEIYPDYKTDYKVASEFQSYTLNYFYGASMINPESASLDVNYTGFRIDILSNIVGYILVIVGTLKLNEVSKVFSLSRLLAYVGLVLSLLIKALPFMLNGYKLCYIVLLIGVAELFAAISVSYLFVYAVCTLLDDVVFKVDRTYIGMSYIGMSILMLVVAFVTWVSAVNPLLKGFYVLFCAFVTGLLIYHIHKVEDYIIKEREL